MPAAVSATFNSVSPILTPVVAAHEQHRANRFAVGNNRADDLRRVVRVLIFFRRHCHHPSAALLIQGNGLSLAMAVSSAREIGLSPSSLRRRPLAATT